MSAHGDKPRDDTASALRQPVLLPGIRVIGYPGLLRVRCFAPVESRAAGRMDPKLSAPAEGRAAGGKHLWVLKA